MPDSGTISGFAYRATDDGYETEATLTYEIDFGSNATIKLSNGTEIPYLPDDCPLE